MKPNGVAAVLDVAHRRVVCVGAGPVAVRKLRKVMGKAQTVIVIAPKAEPMIRDWHEPGNSSGIRGRLRRTTCNKVISSFPLQGRKSAHW